MQHRFHFPRYTYDDYKQWKEDWELIDGYPFQALPSATAKHSSVQGKFYLQFNESLKGGGDCNCMIFFELDWRINPETVVRPDVMVVCGKAVDEYLEFPPVLIVEVISPQSVKKDRGIKFQLYQEQGVKFYILADYIKQTIEVFELIDNVYRSVDKNTFEVAEGCAIGFDKQKIWA